ncbi:MAG: hypothetical protein Fur0025_48680 [Oscillatoriaceae cyanobacterium]|uniref:type II toxin-antitoxin system MazE family antitoxin n=1 Tax=[Phormidium] sp. ETS-05 TaxID=222819 RepID=UPI0018EF349F|nr:hypothetical protein [[Phormidium] sp. ETS-05]
MSKKISITLDDEILDFVDGKAKNRSNFINRVLREEKKRILMQELAAAYQEQANDEEFRHEVSVWDITAGDGINA